MFELEVKCPKKKCEGYAEASVSDDEGNTEGPCDTCGAQIGFHYCIEIDSVYIVDSEESEKVDSIRKTIKAAEKDANEYGKQIRKCFGPKGILK